jgi:hypothetical protein
MSWAELLADKKVKAHATSLAELNKLRQVVARDISDGQVTGLSADRRFACLYSAALQLAHMAVACAGYRVATTTGHHKTSLESMELCIGNPVRVLVTYFDFCRRKRNMLEYDNASLTSEIEVQELLRKVKELELIVENWIATNHPNLSPQA